MPEDINDVLTYNLERISILIVETHNIFTTYSCIIYIYIYIYIYICVCVCIYVYMHMYVCIYVCYV